MQKALSEAAQLLHLLVDMGLKINGTKSASLLTIGGTQSAAIRKRLFSPQSPKIVLEHGAKQWKLPLVRKHVYLGASISYHSKTIHCITGSSKHVLASLDSALFCSPNGTCPWRGSSAMESHSPHLPGAWHHMCGAYQAWCSQISCLRYEADAGGGLLPSLCNTRASREGP